MFQDKTRILVVDDSAAWRELLVDALKEQGFDVIGSASSEDAFRILDQTSATIDFVLMDQVLVGSHYDGIRATQFISQRFPSIRVIVMTVYGEGESSHQALKAGAYRYVFRSTDPNEAVIDIVAIIQSAKNLAKMENDLQDSFWTRQVCPGMGMALGIVDRAYRILYENERQNKLAGGTSRRGGICWIEWHQATQQKEPCSWCPVKPIFDGKNSEQRVIPLIKHGRLQYWQTSASPIFSEDGAIIAALKWGLEVTPREEAHQAALQAADVNERLEHALSQINMLGYARARLYELATESFSENAILFGRKATGGEDITSVRLTVQQDLFSQRTLNCTIPIIYHKAQSDPFPEEPALYDVDEWLEIPLVAKDGQVLGKISVDNKIDQSEARPDKPSETRQITQEHFETLILLAGFAANSIRDARNNEQIQRQLELQRQLRELDAKISRELNLQPLLQSIIERAVELLSADGGSLLLCDYLAKNLKVEVTHCLDFLKGKTFAFGEGLAGKVVNEPKPLIINDYHNWQFHSQQLDEENSRRTIHAMVGVPIFGPQDHLIGVLVVSAQDPNKRFIEYDAEVLSSFASRVSIAIQNAKRFEEKNALLDVSKNIGSDLRWEEITKKVFESTRKLIAFERGLLFLWDKAQRKLVVEGSMGYDPEFLEKEGFKFKLGEGYTGRIAELRKPLLISDTHEPREITAKYTNIAFGLELRSYVGIPLIIRDELIGVFALTSSIPAAFHEEHIQLLTALSSQITVAYDQARLFRETDRRAAQLGAINQIAVAMRGEDDPKTVIRIALTGATAEPMLKFSRAMYFMVNEDEQVLEGMTAIGALTKKEAEADWLQAKGMDLEDYVKAARTWPEGPHGELDKHVRGIRISLNEAGGALAAAVTSRKTQIIKRSRNGENSTAELKSLQLGAFAVVPLIAKDKPVGVILVDNKFLPHPFIREDVSLLETLAAIAAVAYENARLIKSQKETFAEIAHQLHSPMTTIKGYVTLLLERRVTEAKKIEEYYRFIAEAVENLSGLADNLLDIKKIDSGVFTLVPTKTSVREIVNKATDYYRFAAAARKIDVRIFFEHSDATEILVLDQLKMITALQNLVENAIKYSHRESSVEITTSDEGGCLYIRVADHGIGIPKHDLKKLFLRHFRGKLSRKYAIDGTGLGLTIAEFIVRKHGGLIKVSSQVGKGSIFTIILPIRLEARQMEERNGKNSRG